MCKIECLLNDSSRQIMIQSNQISTDFGNVAMSQGNKPNFQNKRYCVAIFAKWNSTLNIAFWVGSLVEKTQAFLFKM